MRALVGAVVAIVVVAVLPYGVSSYTIHVANVALIFCMLAVGMFLTMGMAGQINLAQVAFFGVGAYFTAIVTTQHHWNFWAAAVCATATSVVIGLIVGIPALRMQSHYLGIVTLGLAVAFSDYVSNAGYAGAAEGISGIPGPEVPGLDLTNEYLYFYLEAVFLALLIGLAAFVVHTPLGRRLRAMRDDNLAAAAMGAAVPVLRMTAFALGGLYGGVAGFLYSGLIHFVAPESFSLANMFLLLAMVIIGGRYSLTGVVIGAVGLTAMREALANFSTYAQLAYGSLVVLMVVFAPTGIAGLPRRVAGILHLRRRDTVGDRGVAAYTPSSHAAADAPEPDAPLSVEVSELTKDFKGLRALDRVSLTAREGEILGIVGPNGSGKTTLFNVMSGLYTPSSGAVRIFGRPTNRAASYRLSLRGLARTFQNLRLFGLLSVRENVMVAADRSRMVSAWLYFVWPFAVWRHNHAIREKTDEVLERYGLASLGESLPSELSYGAQRRVEVARAMASEPRLLLLDEPAAGLNGEEINQLRMIIGDIRAQGTTVLVIEHNMGLVMSLCDRVVVLANGTVIADGLPAEVARNHEVIEAYLGEGMELEATPSSSSSVTRTDKHGPASPRVDAP
jgi:branched-chain amino acid transport system permease protein